MQTCLACGGEVSEGNRFCGGCGAALASLPLEPTGPYHPAEPSPNPPTPLPLLEGARFTPGQVLAERYRIVSRLGKGGMGEVYRADDLRLGQPVALKFLPQGVADDPQRLAYFHEEVKLARQVSHPNVCRVYDIAEAEGQIFLSMEFIDGEDLASLLKRIGRLPPDKGVQIAQQLCAGLAAAHEKGVIHRDLKPANIMLDGRGHVRITDFGLARVAEKLQGNEVLSGTPAYMAPEQLAGKEVTVRSDIYALGLVLYEVFTGKRAFSAKTIDELLRLQEESTPPRPSSRVSDLEAAVDEAIVRCLEHDPRKRPQSALAVAVALSGSDSLAVALLAGETPSPQTIANAPVVGSLHPLLGLALLAAFVLAVTLCLFMNDQIKLVRQVPLEHSPRDMSNRARVLLADLGYDERPVDSVGSYLEDWRYPGFLQQFPSKKALEHGLQSGQPPVLYFWYRQSRVPLVNTTTRPSPWIGQLPGTVRPWIPPLQEPGEILLCLDVHGRLLELVVVPSEISTKKSQPDWHLPLVRAAGVSPEHLGEDFRVVAPKRVPPVPTDDHLAWEGSLPGQNDLQVRMEAGAHGGKPVYFHMVIAGVEQPRWNTGKRSPGLSAVVATYLLIGAVWIVGAPLAVQNLRRGRANLRGAVRLGAVYAGAYLLLWVGSTHHSIDPGVEVFGFLGPALGRITLDTSVCVLAYLALEPYIRRRWPWRIVAWNRVLEGRWKDPLVGRDVLLGLVIGMGIGIVSALGNLSPTLFGDPIHLTPSTSVGESSLTLLVGLTVLISPLVQFFILFLLCLLFRREWLGFLVVLIGLSVVQLGLYQVWLRPVSFLCLIVGNAVLFLILLRFGLLAYLVGFLAHFVIMNLPLGTELSAWYAPGGLLNLVLLGAMGLYGFLIAKADRPLFREGLLEGN